MLIVHSKANPFRTDIQKVIALLYRGAAHSSDKVTKFGHVVPVELQSSFRSSTKLVPVEFLLKN